MARTAADSARHPGEDVVPVRPVERGDGVDEQRALARAGCRRGAASGRRPRPARGSGCSSAAPATSSSATPRVAGGRRGEDPADRRQRGLVAGEEQVPGRPVARAAPAPATPSSAPGAAAAAQAAAGPSPCRTKSISTCAGGRVLAAGGVAAQAHPVGAVGPDDPAVLGHPRPARRRVADARDEQVDGRAGRGHGGGGAGEDHPAHRRRHVGDGDDGQHVDRRGVRRVGVERGVGSGHVARQPGTGRPGRPRGNGVDRAGDRGRVRTSHWVADRPRSTSADAIRPPSTCNAT